jgi:methylated-DNA-[protein]-cysteine S-methyltransferase
VSSLESALRQAARAPTAEPAEAAARRFADAAAASGAADVTYALEDSPLGPLFVAVTPRGLVEIGYEPSEHLDSFLARLAERVSPRILEAPGRLDEVRRQLDEYFAGRRREFDLPLDWSLTRQGFGRRVLQHTARIPYGEALSYREVAAQAGSPRGSRAAGNALGANPIPIVVPCHRVLRSGGAVGGYGGGVERKRRLLALEGTLEDAV